jgi:hypothetical protein
MYTVQKSQVYICVVPVLEALHVVTEALAVADGLNTLSAELSNTSNI